MRTQIKYVLIVFALVVAVVTVAPAATAASGDATLQGTITDSATGLPFPSGELTIVDLFRTSDGFRLRAVLGHDGVEDYQIQDIPPGDYRLRFRHFGTDSVPLLTHYQWYASAGPVTNYDDADTITFGTDEVESIDQALVPVTSGGSIVVAVTDAATSSPPPLDFCRFVTVFEASGIGLGISWPLDTAGPFDFATLPDGDYKVVFAQRYGESDNCTASSPEYLDQWYGGARGTGFIGTSPASLANAPYFSTGSAVTVAGGAVPVELTVRQTPQCDGLVPTIIGTSLRDTIDGTAGDDVIIALGGRDTVRGLGGNDRICAGSGADTVRGGSGADRIFGQGGNDNLRGNGGADYIRGGSGNDVIRGGGGDDDLRGNRGNDTITGGSGTDVARGGQGIDSCIAETVIRCE